MTTVAQMIEWLKTLPQDAEVECGVERTGGYSTYMEMCPVDIEYCTVLDYRDEVYSKSCPTSYGRVIVQIEGL
jgi:hypothetical protein